MNENELLNEVLGKKITSAELYTDQEGSICVKSIVLDNGRVVQFSASGQIEVDDVFIDITD